MTGGTGGGGTAATQILVIGGGPSGLCAALDLAQRGVRVAVVDQGLEPLPGVRAGGFSHQTMENLRRLGVAKRLRAKAPIPPGWPRTTVMTTRLAGPAFVTLGAPAATEAEQEDARQRTSEGPQNAPSAVLERILRDELLKLPNAAAYFGYRFEGELEQTTDSVRVVLHGGDGPIEVVAGYVIAADGANSTVRDVLGVPTHGSRAFATRWTMQFASPGLREAMGHGTHNQYWAINHDMVAYLLQRDPVDQWTLQIQEASEAFQASFDDPALLLEQVFGKPVELSSAERPKRWRANAFWAERLSVGRVFLVGDAAHAMPPGGLGLHLGIGDAANLSWKLAAVLQGEAGPALLDSYHDERIMLARAYVLAVETAPHPIRAAALQEPELEGDGPAASAALARITEVAVATRAGRTNRSALAIYDTMASSVIFPPEDEQRDAVVNGRRLPHRWLGEDDSIFDHVQGRLTLVGSRPEAVSAFVAAAESIGAPLAVVPVPGGMYERELILVRPDFVVAWSGDACADPVGTIAMVLGVDLAASAPRR